MTPQQFIAEASGTLPDYGYSDWKAEKAVKAGWLKVKTTACQLSRKLKGMGGTYKLTAEYHAFGNTHTVETFGGYRERKAVLSAVWLNLENRYNNGGAQ